MPKIAINCAECKRKNLRWPSQIKKYKYGVFCNLNCLGKYRTKTLVGELAANYKIGSRQTRGYIEVEASWHPNSNKRGYVSLHRLIAEAKLNRFLKKNEVVHHIDENRRNNHWNNLEVLSQSEHAKIHNNKKNRRKNGTFINQ